MRHHLLSVLLLGALMFTFACTPTTPTGGAGDTGDTGAAAAGVFVFGDATLYEADTGTADFAAVTTLPAGSLQVGSVIHIRARAYGASYYNEQTYNQETPSMGLSIAGQSVLSNGYVGDEMGPSMVTWTGRVMSATELQWVDTYPSSTSSDVSGGGFDITADVSVVVTLQGGGDGPRGVMTPVVTVYPPAVDTGA